jgi:dihydrofolate synthase/folylpolyglutamate synthase
MDYQSTIDYLFTRLPQFSRIGAAAYKTDLTNTIALCAHLGNPQLQFKSVHIAGTNGKGSVSHMLAAIFQKAGYKTGLYTSPHLKDFRERIRINGEMISKEFVIDFTERMKEEANAIEPSFFEITVAMAFDYFAKEKVDIAIIETGLGGRLDSTNIITPELSVITNIGMDHMNLLGDTIEKIAAEKAGIIKNQVPVVVGETLPATMDIFISTASHKQAPLLLAEERTEIISWKSENGWLHAKVKQEAGEPVNYQLDLSGIYQLKNLRTVLTAVKALQNKGWNLNRSTVQEALRSVKSSTGLHGRWDILHRSPLLIVDVAHNEDGIREVVAQMKSLSFRKAHLIMGVVNDKDTDTVLRLLPKDASYYFTRAQIPRALPEEELQQKAALAGLKGKAYSSVNTALYAASLNAQKDDLILICGSIFVIGELSMESVRSIWGREPYATGTADALELAAWAFFH